MASPWAVVARREFLERVRTKWFLIVTLLGPVGMFGLIFIPAWIGKKAAEERAVIDVVDHSGQDLAETLRFMTKVVEADLEVRDAPIDMAEDVLLDRIAREDIQGYLILPADVLDGGKAIYRGDNAANLGFLVNLQQVVSGAVIAKRASREGLDAIRLAGLMRPVAIDHKQTTGGEAKGATESYIVGIVVMMILYMSIILYAVNVMRSVVQEKTSRVVEVVVSAIRPTALMLGKVVGVGSVGLLQLGIWAGCALVLINLRGGVMALLGLPAGVDLPVSLGAGDLALILGYFVLGYFFYAALYAGLGAMVNSEQEAQQVQTPVILLLMVPILMSQAVAGDPRGGVAQVLTILPFSSPVLMPMRWVLGGATALDVALSLVVLAISIAGVVYLAARVYRIGILMYGKRPSLRELGRWMRHG